MNKKLLIFLITSFFSLYGQSRMFIHKSDKICIGVPLGSINFSVSIDSLSISANGNSASFPWNSIDSVSFTNYGDTVYVHYESGAVTIINPLAFENVQVTTTGEKVEINSRSSIKGLNYKISGTTTDGSLKIYSANKFNLILDNLNLTNANGPAINVQSGKTTSIILPAGTASFLKDGTSYPDSIMNNNGVMEDQNAALFFKGNVDFSGAGSLTITGTGADKHGIATKDEMTFNGATLVVNSAAKDGLHPKDGFTMNSGSIKVTSAGDGIDADEGFVSINGGSITTKSTAAGSDGISSYQAMKISNAEINITVAGDAGKGLNSGHSMTLGTGNYTINTSGNAVLTASGAGYEPSYCSAIKGDSVITINGAVITITSIGKAGKGISSDKDIIINSGTITITTSGAGAVYTNTSGIADCYHSTCITADGKITIVDGTVTTSSSGSAGRGITADSTLTIGSTNTIPNINLTTTGTKITVSGSGTSANYCEAKALTSDVAVIINNGSIKISSADDGIKSDGILTINNGTITILKSVEGMEAPYININGGTVDVTASDDGINCTFGEGGEANDGSLMKINGGSVYVNTTKGDGLDGNGSIAITGGTIIVNGPPSAPEVGLDYNGTCTISGGLLLVSGPNSGNMIQATSTSSAQYAIKASTTSLITATTLFHLQDASGNSLLTFKPIRNAYYIVFSSAALLNGGSYSIYTGGTCTGTSTNGYYVGGTYSGGTLKKTFTVTSKVTAVTF